MEEIDPQLEFYVDTNNERWDASIQQMFSPVELNAVVKRTLQKTGITQPVMLTLLITDDSTIQDMNKQYREQNKPTDVLSFPLLEQPLAKAPADQLWAPSTDDEGKRRTVEEKTPAFVTPPDMITNLGDIVISWPTLIQQATEAGHTTSYELFFLLAHGVLHLIGYDDQNEAGYQAMVSIQQSALEAVGQKA
jgi:probable rRNA maturation factor